MDLYLFLADPATAGYAGFLYVISLYILARTVIKAKQADRPAAQKVKRSTGRHVASRSYEPRWSTPTTPRDRALTDAPQRYLSTWDTAPMKVITQPIPVRTPVFDDNWTFVQAVGRTVRPMADSVGATVVDVTPRGMGG